MNLKFMRCDNERADNHQTICFRKKKKKLMSVFQASVLLLTLMNFVITLSKKLKVHSAIAS